MYKTSPARSLCRNHDPVTQESYIRLGTIFLLRHTHHSYHHTEEDMHQLMDERKDNQGLRTPLTLASVSYFLQQSDTVRGCFLVERK